MVASNLNPPTTITTKSSSANGNLAAATTPPSAVSAASSATTHKPKNTSLPNGAVAGVAIGSAIVGALLTFLVVFLLMKRSKRSGGGRHRHSRDVEFEKPASRPELAFEENLLERADDSQIRKSMQDLSELIDQHVENYYHLQSLEGNQGSLERRLVDYGYDGQSAQGMVAVLKNPKTRFVGIRQLIAKVIVRNIDFKARAEVSLLPPQIAGFFQSLPPVERQPGCEEVFDKAFTKWRQLAAFLLSPTRASREAPSVTQREMQSAIAQNVALINTILVSFVKPGPESQRYQQDNLSAIVFEGAQLGLLLFSQPSTWVFGWSAASRDESGGRGKNGAQVTTSELGKGNPWVVFPGIGESVERHGRQRVRDVAAPVVVKL